ncbi:hypothetical protein LTR36_002765 [Oleoguttula mirabilis]|uniref:Uncharacterized protein n=1 Tax=Oleoguttula mirabilis TaxID=1507867 RepID=A0AAV9JLN3_9PEZI|nr:hypothetical protein LTR36_002765 [Oleoguttula mirabilis]
MPAIPGETLLTTLFADAHYYFSDPSVKPQHHRFDRGSYVYIYHNATEHKAKLEVANHAGSPDQDAFSGSLQAASVQYSFKQPTLVTLRVDAYIQDQSQWHLPSYNERNEQKYLYKLHSVDIYLWTEKDAAAFLGHLKAVMPASRLEIKDAPSTTAAVTSDLPAEHRSSMSPVVQQLEHTAIGAHFPPRAESTVSAHGFPGPPTPATSVGGATASPQQRSPPYAAPMAYNPAAPPAPEPIAHREKTPPPPDDGSGHGLTGASAGKYDARPQYASTPQAYQPHSNQPTPQQAYFSGPPQQASLNAAASGFAGPPRGTPPNSGQRTYSAGLPPPPPPSGGPSPLHQQQQQQQHYAPSFAGPPVDQNAQPTSPPPHQQNFNRQSSFGGPPAAAAQYATYPTQPQPQTQTQTQYASFGPTSPGFGPSLGSPGMPPTPGYQSMQQQPPTPSAPPAYGMHTPLQSPGLLPPPPPLTQPPPQQAQQQPAVAGYSGYNYSAAQTPAAAAPLNAYGAYTGDVHGQTYRPTEAEAAHGHGHHAAKPPPVSRQDSSTKVRMEERVSGVEKRVGGFLKRLDKLI